MKKRPKYFSPAQARIVTIMLGDPTALIYSNQYEHLQQLYNGKEYDEEGIINLRFHKSTLRVLVELECLVEVRKEGNWPVYRLVNSSDKSGQTQPPA